MRTDGAKKQTSRQHVNMGHRKTKQFNQNNAKDNMNTDSDKKYDIIQEFSNVLMTNMHV